MDRLTVSRSFTVAAAQPAASEFERLAADGFNTVVNLCVPGEDGEHLTPAEERAAVEAAGMAYLHIPVPGGAMSAPAVDRFRREVSAVGKPVFVHCASGRRAMACTLLHLGLREGLSADDILARAEAHGFVFARAPLEAFIRDYVRRDHETYEKLEQALR